MKYMTHQKTFNLAHASKLMLVGLLGLILSACGGGAGTEEPSDDNPPVITLNGSDPVSVFQFDSYSEAGASATDERDGNVDVIITGIVDTNTLGSYTVTYSATDAAGNNATVARTVNVILSPDTTPPMITLNGSDPVSIFQFDSYSEAGASATDERDGNVDVIITGVVDTNTLGSYTVTYSATDAAGNNATVTRTVNVLTPDVTPPVITLNGASSITLNQGDSYIEEGVAATDDRDGTVNVVITGTVDTNIVGTYTLTYTATDTSNNTGTATRAVNVLDTTSPVVILNGASSITLGQGESYIEEGATAIDDSDGTVNVVITSAVDTNTIGVYTLTYTATDTAGNSGEETRTINIVAADAFITTWKTDNTGATDDNQIKIGTSGSGYNYQVDWGDGSSDSGVTGDIIHTYASAGTYLVTITGDFPRIFFDGRFLNSDYDSQKILSIERWGNRQWQSMSRAFSRCSNLVINASDIPNLSQVTDMSSMFAGARTFNQDISNWDVSSVRDMRDMFREASAFNQDISSWDVSSVIYMNQTFLHAGSFNQDISNWDVSSAIHMYNMFAGASAFNQDISSWDVSSVTTMHLMFRSSAFNQDISNWDVSSVTNMSWMFSNARAFNQNIGSWDVSSVNVMNNMFNGASAFNQAISSWDVSSVTAMHNMFSGARAFNQDISNWDVSSVTRMDGMFFNTTAFNQDISNWDVSSVTRMDDMFFNATAFNQDISNWDVSSVIHMDDMFSNASTFNQNLSSWDVSSVTRMSGMFRNALAFNQDISIWNVSSVINMANMFQDITLSTDNYDALLLGWSVQSLQNDVVFSGGNSTYSASSQGARDTLTGTYNWTVTDGGDAP